MLAAPIALLKRSRSVRKSEPAGGVRGRFGVMATKPASLAPWERGPLGASPRRSGGTATGLLLRESTCSGAPSDGGPRLSDSASAPSDSLLPLASEELAVAVVMAAILRCVCVCVEGGGAVGRTLRELKQCLHF